MITTIFTFLTEKIVAVGITTIVVVHSDGEEDDD